jgi:hypothetical protein
MADASQIPQPVPPFACGQCGTQFDPAASASAEPMPAQSAPAQSPPAHCPHCGISVTEAAIAQPEPAGDIEIIADDDDVLEGDDEPSGEDAADELSSLHIRQVSALRRGAYRARAYCVVTVSALLFAAVELAMMTLRNARTGGPKFLSAMYVATGALALIFSWKLGGRIMELTRELKEPLLSDPDEPPDFSTLSDGSQHARYLAEMQEIPNDKKDRS